MHIETPATSFVLRGVSWATYEELDRARGDSCPPRLAYLDGDLEVIVPGSDHEWWKKTLARLVEAYGEETDILVTGLGSTTYRDRAKHAGLEADECYFVGEDCDPMHGRPDLALEVSASRTGLNKLEIYRRLGIKEVWLLEDEQLLVYRLRGDEYRKLARSVCFPQLDLVDIARRVVTALPLEQQKVVVEFRKRLRERR